MSQIPRPHIRQRCSSNIGNLIALSGCLFIICVNAIPAPTAAANIPSDAPTPTTYISTKISSTTLTTSSPVLHISPHILELITTMTVTTYEPWPSFASLGMGPGLEKGMEKGEGTWSSTVLEEVVSSVTWVERRRYLDQGTGSGGIRKQEETTVTSFVVTTENTWIVHPAGPTGIYLPASMGEVGCGDCGLAESTSSESKLDEAQADNTERKRGEKHNGTRAMRDRDIKPNGEQGVRTPKSTEAVDAIWTREEAAVLEDPTCLSSNLTTGCQGQCLWKPSLSPDTPSPATGPGTYWCLHIHPYQYSDPSLRMGRACWGSFLRYRQLNKPCLVGDVGMACLPCVNGGDGAVGGRDQSWDAVFWEGEE
ncbi:hypothetical protein B0T20DRAFT_404766 [Sordaria brevicollis]|uniref:Uncharacterized protein n=1 Tax=Sordaria brevicollis TaxID=83679 RepID=A0AAE0PIS1_SORBR|nr:hypothetical protein B0T20DRAFT_404766 [Sordaria brevicollis]